MSYRTPISKGPGNFKMADLEGVKALYDLVLLKVADGPERIEIPTSMPPQPPSQQEPSGKIARGVMKGSEAKVTIW